MVFNIFSGVTLAVNYNLTIEEMIAKGTYDEVDPGITSQKFPLKKIEVAKVEVYTIPCTDRESTPMVEAAEKRLHELPSRKFSPIEHLLELGIQLTRNLEARKRLLDCIWPYPNKRIISIGSSIDPMQQFVCMEIYNQKTKLKLRDWEYPPARYLDDAFLISK